MGNELQKAIDLIDAGIIDADTGGIVGLGEARETVLKWARRVANLDWGAASQANRGRSDHMRDIVFAALGITTEATPCPTCKGNGILDVDLAHRFETIRVGGPTADGRVYLSGSLSSDEWGRLQGALGIITKDDA